MSIYSKLIVLIILFAFLVGCKAETPESPKTPTTDTGTTSYVGEWWNSDRNTAIDWRSDSFIYACLVSTYTYATHGSFSSSNSRLTWWDGTYNTISSSGSNILFDSTTYEPAVLYANCNPWWTYHTNENPYYTNAAKSMGYWTFVFTYNGTTYTENIMMSSISSRTYSDGNFYTAGTDSSGNVVTGGYLTSSGKYDILDTSNSSYNDYYTFTINSTYTGISSGCYYYYTKSTSTYSSCYSLTSGTKSYGTPRSYRIISDNDEEKIAMNQIGTRITAEDIKAYKRYQHLLRIHNSTDKEPLKRFLHSFRTN